MIQPWKRINSRSRDEGKSDNLDAVSLRSNMCFFALEKRGFAKTPNSRFIEQKQHRILPKDEKEDVSITVADFFLSELLVPKMRQNASFSSAPAEHTTVPSGDTARCRMRDSCAKNSFISVMFGYFHKHSWFFA